MSMKRVISILFRNIPSRYTLQVRLALFLPRFVLFAAIGPILCISLFMRNAQSQPH
jgi:hypothetical protein